MFAGCVGLGLLYYRNVLFVFLFLPFGLLWIRGRSADADKKEKSETCEQFSDLLKSLKSSLATGSNLERSVRRAPGDLKVIWDDPDEKINIEIKALINNLDNNMSIEEGFAIMAKRLEIDEAKEFADSIKLCNRNGGNVNEAISFSTEALEQQMMLSREFEIATAEKQTESKILLIMPHAMLLLLNLTTGAYLTPLYTSWLGRGIMSIVLLIIWGAWYAAKRITY